jgi:hypothetical protein
MSAPKPTPAPLLKNAAAAPFVYFDAAPTLGLNNAVVSVELAAQITLPKPDQQVQTDLVCVAHLRCSLNAAMNLREALDKAIAMANGGEGSSSKH